MASLVSLAPRLTFGSLGSGIGGADLGLQSLGWTLAWQVERDEGKRAVLAAHWPGTYRAVIDIASPTSRVMHERVDVVHCEPTAPEAEYVDPVLAWITAARPERAIIDLASRNAAAPLYRATCYALARAGYRVGAMIARYQTCAVVDGAVAASHVRARVVLLAALPPLPAPPDLSGEVRSILFTQDPAWDPASEHEPETALASDVLERVRLLPSGWTAALQEPARLEALRAVLSAIRISSLKSSAHFSSLGWRCRQTML